jgi:hypothetical protein
VIVLVNVLAIASLIDWFNIRKRLIAVEQAAASGHYGPGRITTGDGRPDPRPLSGDGARRLAPDPSGEHGLRWWDGGSWTEHTWSGSASGPAPTPGQ